MLKRVASFTLILLALSTMAGCAMDREVATTTSPSDLRAMRSFYVVKSPKDYNNTDQLIKNYLTKKGYAVTTGPELPLPYPTDGVVTYADSWSWDLTLYLRELTIDIKDPNTNVSIANANSLHTALTKESPELMVMEVMKNAIAGDINIAK